MIKSFLRKIAQNNSTRSFLKKEIDNDIKIRSNKNTVPSILNIEHVKKLCNELKNPIENEKEFLLYQFKNRILPGVDETSKIKASFLNDIIYNKQHSPVINRTDAINILGTMQGGYNVEIMINLLNNDELAPYVVKELKNTILIFDYYYTIEKLYKKGNPFAKEIIESWASGEWFKNKTTVPEKISLTVFKVNGEINTDDLSPAQDAWSRPDIPLHSLCMFKNERDDINPDDLSNVGPINEINLLKKGSKYPVAFAGDVVGTGSSRKSATNSLLWHFGNDIPYVPNKRTGGYCIGSKIAPIFFNTMEDSGALPIEMPVKDINRGDVIDIYPYEGLTKCNITNEVICKWSLKTETILDSVQAGGRINLIIGKELTKKSQSTLNKDIKDIFISNKCVEKKNQGFTLAQKIVGKACGVDGIFPGNYCEPSITTVGSQDTTGPMTRDELKDLACLGFSSDLVMQSFCHTAAYPKPIDIITHNTLPEFMNSRGGISLKPGDGIIHSWLNRMLLPDTVGTGGDSHTRFPIGISFPAGSGLVAFAAATGIMPLHMPESVLVKFIGNIQPGITLRDIVHSIPYFAKKRGLLTIDKRNKINVFNGKILEIEGLPNLTCEQAFEISDATAERSAAGCTIKLSEESVIEYLKSNICLLNWMINEKYNDINTIQRRISKMKEWIKNPQLMDADSNAKYAETLIIDLNEIKEPILCAPNDPDDAVLLSEVQHNSIDEVFIGSCMTNIGHFRASAKLLDKVKDKLATKLWIAPPTKMDQDILISEGIYDTFTKVNANKEMPGCSLCMGNQARVKDNSNVLSTSTRNFPNRLGKGANVYLASAELSAITSIEGKIPDMKTYMKYYSEIDKNKDKIFNYLNFDKIPKYSK